MKKRGLHSSIALHPSTTDDSGQVLGLSPNRRDLSYRDDFGGENILDPLGTAIRSCSEYLALLLMVSAPLPGIVQFRQGLVRSQETSDGGFIFKSL